MKTFRRLTFFFLFCAFLYLFITETIYSYVLPQKNLSNTVIINEIMADNISSIIDEDMQHISWIVLFNPTNEAILIDNWYLSDDYRELDKYLLEEKWIQPGEHYIVQLDDRLRLNSEKEHIYLCNSFLEIVDEVFYTNLDSNYSYGRKCDINEYGVLAKPTPGKTNVGILTNNDDVLLSCNIIPSHASGIYEQEFILEFETDVPDTLILYTLDGTSPKNRKNAIIYGQGVEIGNNDSANKLVTIPCNNNYYNFAIEYGINNVRKMTVVNVCAYKDGKFSEVRTLCYLFGESYSLPIVSICADYDDLFGPDGIYVGGSIYHLSQKLGKSKIWIGNWSIDRSIDADIKFFSTDGNILADVPADIKIAGNASKLWPQQKSFNVETKSSISRSVIWGNSDEKLCDRFLIRGQSILNVSSVKEKKFLNDLLINMMYKDIDNASFDDVPVILFLNGEYWGIYTVKEAKDSEFFYNRYGINKNDIVSIQSKSSVNDKLVWEVKSGSEEAKYDLIELYDTIKGCDLSDKSNYEWLKSQIDVDNYMDFCIAKIWAETDTPYLDNNVLIWKSSVVDERNAYMDGRWRWISFDYDNAFSNAEDDTINKILKLEGLENHYTFFSALLFQKLWANDEFQRSFSEKLIKYLDKELSATRLQVVLDEYIELIEPEIVENIDRLDYAINTRRLSMARSIFHYGTYSQANPPASYADWSINNANIRFYIENRGKFLLFYLNEDN